jgi:hypothetical protein
MFGNTLIVVHIMPLSVIYILFLVGYADSSVNYAIKKFYNIDTWSQCSKTFFVLIDATICVASVKMLGNMPDSSVHFAIISDLHFIFLWVMLTSV